MSRLTEARLLWETTQRMEADAWAEWQREPRTDGPSIAYAALQLARRAQMHAQELYNDLLALEPVQDVVGSAE